MDVFVSYSSLDKDIVENIVEKLENSGFSCWYAPRDIKPGQEWVKAINGAMEEAKIFLFVYTENSNRSGQVYNEIALAFHLGKILIPYRLSDIPMSSEIKYYLTRVHWLDAANKPLEQGNQELVQVVDKALKGEMSEDDQTGVGKENGSAQEENAVNGKGKKAAGGYRVWICLTATLLVVAVVLVILFRREPGESKDDYLQGQALWKEGSAQEAREYFEKAAQQEDPLGKLALATLQADELIREMHSPGSSVNVREEGEKLRILGEELVADGCLEGYYLAGLYYAEGMDGVRRKEAAIDFFERVLQGEEEEWILRSYGYLCHLYSTSDSDSSASLEMTELYANQAKSLLEGTGSRADWLSSLPEGIEQHENWPAYAIACNQIGEAFRNLGEGAKAFPWYQRAAEAGMASAMNHMGLAYLMGDGAEENEELAREWFQKASDAGDENARANLEYMIK